MSGKEKILPFNRLSTRMQQLHDCSWTVVATGGCFDLLHVGHIRMLQHAASMGGVLIVLLNSDASVKRLKGPKRPIVPEEERAEMLAALECVSYVTMFDEDTPEKALRIVRPDIWVKSEQYDPRSMAETDTVREVGGIVRVVPHWAGFSTSELVMRIGEEHG
jgi:D-beta-D-heptose 7-phosphate kinase/D-beta-D-heptose 1-phosphate adenosyltransferase